MDKFLEPPKKQNTAAAAAALYGASATTDSTGSAMKGKKNASFNANKQNLQYQIAAAARAERRRNTPGAIHDPQQNTALKTATTRASISQNAKQVRADVNI